MLREPWRRSACQGTPYWYSLEVATTLRQHYYTHCYSILLRKFINNHAPKATSSQEQVVPTRIAFKRAKEQIGKSVWGCCPAQSVSPLACAPLLVTTGHNGLSSAPRRKKTLHGDSAHREYLMLTSTTYLTCTFHTSGRSSIPSLFSTLDLWG